jgi:hypothetical protein
MRYPNLRYGNPEELRYYAQGTPTRDLARRLRRDERTIRDYLSGAQRVPWWIPELLRLQHAEHMERLRYMGMRPHKTGLGTVNTAGVVEYRPRELETEKPRIVAESGAVRSLVAV